MSLLDVSPTYYLVNVWPIFKKFDAIRKLEAAWMF
jgi:hypothetical protein